MGQIICARFRDFYRKFRHFTIGSFVIPRAYPQVKYHHRCAVCASVSKKHPVNVNLEYLSRLTVANGPRRFVYVPRHKFPDDLTPFGISKFYGRASRQPLTRIKVPSTFAMAWASKCCRELEFSSVDRSRRG